MNPADVSAAFSALTTGGWKTSEGQMKLLAMAGALGLQFFPASDWVHVGVPAVLALAATLYAHNRTKLKVAGLDALKAAIAAATADLNKPDPTPAAK